MSTQKDSDTVLHQAEHTALTNEQLDGQITENVAIATPAAPGAAYVQAEVVALRTAIADILTALRSSKIIP